MTHSQQFSVPKLLVSVATKCLPQAFPDFRPSLSWVYTVSIVIVDGDKTAVEASRANIFLSRYSLKLKADNLKLNEIKQRLKAIGRLKFFSLGFY